MHVDFLSVVKGGFFFHPSDEDLVKKPLECVLSVYSNFETAVAHQAGLPETSPSNIGVSLHRNFAPESVYFPAKIRSARA